jgi:hypothetical protein
MRTCRTAATSLQAGFAAPSFFLQSEGESEGEGEVVPVLFLNWPPHYEGVLGELKYSPTNS